MTGTRRGTEGSGISVIIVTMNSERFIGECLRSVAEQLSPVDAEIVVVDNASADRTVEMAASLQPPPKIIRASRNSGFSSGNNAGIQASSKEFILLLNPDTIVHPGALEAMRDALNKRADAAGVGPKILNGDGSLQRTGVSFPTLWNVVCEIFFLDKVFPSSRLFGRHKRLYENPDVPYEADYLQGSCLLLRKAMVEDAGLFDEEYFMYFDEADLCRRLRGRGWKIVYDPSAVIVHFGGGGSTYYDTVRLTHFYRSYLRYLTKFEGGVRRCAFRVVLIFRTLTRLAVFAAGGIVGLGRTAEFRERARAYAAVFGILVSE